MKRQSILLSILLTSALAFGQEKAEIQGVREFNNYDYYAAVAKLEHVQKKDAGVLRKLAESYDRIGDTQKSEFYYSQLCLQPDRIPNDHLAYARVLMKNEKYSTAEVEMKTYAKLNPENEEAARFELLNESLAGFAKKGMAIKVNNLSMNTEQEDFAPFVMGGKIYFSSSRSKKNSVSRSWAGNRLPFLDIYSADISGANMSNLAPLKSKVINKKYHEGPVAFSNDGETMYLTVNNYDELSTYGVRHLSLFISKKVGEEWSELEPFPFNSEDYSVGHASVTDDGNTLYFASDMPGGKGGVDIYRCTKVNGVWSVPENLAILNTIGDEMFPYIHPTGLILFSSNGHPGYGGLDIFVGKIENGIIKQMRNVGTPFNSSKDDFSVWMDRDGINGYFSSNRNGGKGNDDIYEVHLDYPFSFARKLEILVLDEKQKPLPGARIVLKNSSGEGLVEEVSDENGMIHSFLDEDGSYSLEGSKKDYFPAKTSFNVLENDNDEISQKIIIEKDPGLQLLAKVTDKKTMEAIEGVKIILTNNFTGKVDTMYTSNAGQILQGIYDKKIGDRISYNLRLEKQGYISKDATFNKQISAAGIQDVAKEINLSLEKMDIGMDLAKAIDLKPIYFDLGKFDIRPDAAIELDKIVKVMNEYPTMYVELGAHTDCRGTAAKNLELSDKRAQASAAYIKFRIQNPERISGRGYGESMILNGCTCEGKKNPKYTEAQHAVNRRTEFLVKKI